MTLLSLLLAAPPFRLAPQEVGGLGPATFTLVALDAGDAFTLEPIPGT